MAVSPFICSVCKYGLDCTNPVCDKLLVLRDNLLIQSRQTVHFEVIADNTFWLF